MCFHHIFNITKLLDMIMSEICFKISQFEDGQVGIKMKQN